ncbi:TIGR00269 family protein [Fervidicoccus fontis]|uniref:TIGR00269 family protein n=1 Tax=Fervidicoccus fontis TaxID=683846 RepID=UPI0023552E92|nr:TIGR00269 family protein [Fervidicoccus fontis]
MQVREIVKCSLCGREAVFYQAFTNKYLCRECFIEDVRKRIANEVKDKRMFSERDNLLLAISGGKDSFVLLDAVSHFHPSSKIIALSIVEGIPGYNRQEYIERIKKYTKERGIDTVITSIKEFVGYSLGEIVEKSREMGIELSPCTYCGSLRRRIINVYARELGADRTLTAHNLDDEVQTIFMNILRGDPERLLRQHPLSPKLSDKLVQRVKPLRKIYEYEAAFYAYLLGFKFQETECPYIIYQPTLRARIRHWLYMLEREAPGVELRILEFFDNLLLDRTNKLKELNSLPTCRICGEPTSIGRDVCKLCEMLEKAGIEPKYNYPKHMGKWRAKGEG